MRPHQLAKAMKHRATYHPELSIEDLTRFAVAQVRAPMTRWQRVGLAIRLAYVALTGRRP